MKTKQNILAFIKTEIESNSLNPNLVVEADTLMENLAIDSISYINLIVKIEEQFDFEFEDNHLLISNYKTIQDFVDYIFSRI